MRISFNQPAFIPWGGFFARLMHSDRMVLLDDTFLARGFTYVNRNRIKGPSGEAWITVPLKRKGRGRQKIKDLEIHGKERWAKDFILTLRHFYAKSLYIEPVLGCIKDTVYDPDSNFLSMVRKILINTKRYLNINTEFVFQSDTGVSRNGVTLLVSLSKELGGNEVLMPYFSRNAVDWNPFRREKITVRFLRYDPPRYPQFWGFFLKRLSILDLLFCCGRAGRKVIERGTCMYEAPGFKI